MNLKEQINADIKTAMLAKEKNKLTALRAIKSMILLAETAKGAVAELSSATEVKLLSKATKQRKDAAEIFTSQNREDLAKKELMEYDIISQYLPKQLSTSELTSELKKIVAQVGADGLRDMGKVMGMTTKTLAGKADGKTISTLVKQILS